MPDKTTALCIAPVLRLERAFDLPHNALGGSNLVGAHHQKGVADIKDRILQKHLQQSVLLEKRRRKILQVFDERIVRLRPVHGEVEAVLVSLYRVGKVSAIRAIGDHEKLEILVERIFGIKALLTVAMHLIKCLADRHTALLQLHLHHGQAIHENGHIIAVGMAARLLKLLDDLQLVVEHIFLIEQVNILNVATIEDEVVDVVVVDFSSLVRAIFTGRIEVLLDEALPGIFGQSTVRALQSARYAASPLTIFSGADSSNTRPP